MQSKLKSDFISGVFYTSIAKYAGLAFSIIISAILARLIEPKDFGLVAIATVFINFFSILTTVGISPAIVQNKTITEIELRSINSFTFVLASALTLIFVAFIPVIQLFYDNSAQLKSILLLLSISIFFSIASIVPNAMILKAKLFKFIALRTFVIHLVFGIISVVCAYLGLGIYALLINPIFSSFCLLIVNFKKFPVGFAYIKKSAIDKILSFSIYQFLFNLVYIGYRNIDKFFIGKFFGMANLGFYEKSYRLMMLPLENVSSVISPVLHPLLSEYQNDKEKIWSSYLKMLRMLSEFSFILSAALFFLSDAIILLLYGENWKFAIPLFKILSLSVCFQLLQAPIGAVLQSINKVKALFYGGLWMLFFVASALLVSWYFNSILVLVFGMDAAFFVGFVIYQIYLAHFFDKSLANIITVIAPHLLYAIIFFALCFAFKYFFLPQSIIASMLIYIPLTIAIFACLKIMGKLPESSILAKDVINKIRGRK